MPFQSFYEPFKANYMENNQMEKKVRNMKEKIYQTLADMTIEQLRVADTLNIQMLWDFWFRYGVSLDFRATEDNILLR